MPRETPPGGPPGGPPTMPHEPRARGPPEGPTGGPTEGTTGGPLKGPLRGPPCKNNCLLVPSLLNMLVEEILGGLKKKCGDSWTGAPSMGRGAPFRGRGPLNIQGTTTTGAPEGGGLEVGPCLLGCDGNCCSFFVPSFCCSASAAAADAAAAAAGATAAGGATGGGGGVGSKQQGGRGVMGAPLLWGAPPRWDPPFFTPNARCRGPHGAPPKGDSWEKETLNSLRALLEAPGDSSEHHIHLQQTTGNNKFSVTIYFAPQFHILRHLLCGDDYQFCLSIKKTKLVTLGGGKSGASFYLSSDGYKP
ncbi:hypothetical protein EMWEY_00044670 [Eimeria maxima]|uniref:Uncharacterized protein n=1 Tax=Eimeria maxima TaxID=5804 RepID=U6MCK6_EIMMA|nr:hypothetical protein EMWEY_00044670 [Eimeria maxima]CDJ61751.1 hypothetical protein EMWEY_00044670 [Eimeria maxima]